MNNKNKGFTLVEVIIVVAVTLIIASFFYQYLTFGLISWRSNIGTSSATSDSRVAMMYLEKEVRQAFAPPSIPGDHGVNIISDSEVVIYSYLSDVEKVISYKVEQNADGDLEMLRVVYDLGDAPAANDWKVIIRQIQPLLNAGVAEPFFQIQNQSLVVSFIGSDERNDTRTPVEVINTFNVRSKGAMPL